MPYKRTVSGSGIEVTTGLVCEQLPWKIWDKIAALKATFPFSSFPVQRPSFKCSQHQVWQLLLHSPMQTILCTLVHPSAGKSLSQTHI